MTAIALRSFATTRDYLELSKSRIVLMVLMTTAAGYLIAAPRVDPLVLVNALVGTALVAAGTNALNQYVEREHDAKMRRTRLRPLPDGRIAPGAALTFSILIAARRASRGIAFGLISIVAVQIMLGALTVWSGKHPIITSLHVMTGAATLALSLIYALTRETQDEPVFVGSEATA